MTPLPPVPKPAAPDSIPSRDQSRSAGMIAIVAGLSTATLIYLHPEQLLTPAWVAYSACMAFVFAGLALLNRPTTGRRGYRWLVVALLVTMMVPPLWAALGPSTQSCSAAILGVAFIPSETVCRSVWGISAGILFALLILAIRWALKKPDESPPKIHPE